MGLWIVALAVLQAAGDSSGTIPAAGLQADVRILRQAYEALHPGLYRYNTKAQMDVRFDSLAQELDRDQTRTEAFLAIARFLSTIRCGHTFPNPYNQSETVERELLRGPVLPFGFYWIDGRMVVTEAGGVAGLERGTEIVSLNGVATTEILQRLLPYSRTDGSNEAKRIANLDRMVGERWQAFDIYYRLLYRPPAERWTVRSSDGRMLVVDVAPPVEGETDRSEGASGAAALGWTVTRPSAGVAVMTMPTWVTYHEKWDWQGWVDEQMARLVRDSVAELVIDIRANEGGTDVGNAIIAHLIDRPLALATYERYTRYRTIPPELKPYLDTWDRSFDDWGADATPSAERPGFYRMRRFDDDPAGSVIQPKAPRFRGKVRVLVGPVNSSATFQFALTMQEAKLGTLVGQPTGGNRRGINGGAFYFLRLPNSGIEVDLPLVALFPVREEEDRGVEPDEPGVRR